MLTDAWVGCLQLTYLSQNSSSGNSKTLVSSRFIKLGKKKHAEVFIFEPDGPEPIPIGCSSERVVDLVTIRHKGDFPFLGLFSGAWTQF